MTVGTCCSQSSSVVSTMPNVNTVRASFVVQCDILFDVAVALGVVELGEIRQCIISSCWLKFDQNVSSTDRFLLNSVHYFVPEYLALTSTVWPKKTEASFLIADMIKMCRS